MPDKQKKLYTVHAPIMGGILNKPDELALGPFIIKKNNYINIKTGEDNPAENFVNFLNNTLASVTHDTEYSILFKVEAKSKEEAIKLSVPFFELFELVAQFLLRGLERVQIGVIHFSTYRLQPFSVTGDGDNDFSMTFKPQNVTCPIQFELLTKKEDCSSIWRLMEKMANGKCTKMESRVLNAIFWIGRAEREYQLPNKYVEYVFAIETLLSFNPKGVIVTPSIAYQLSEFAAFIISEAITECDSLKQERIKIMK